MVAKQKLQEDHVYNCQRIQSYPSPVVTFQIDFLQSDFRADSNKIPVHVMLDCGANVSFITTTHCHILGIDKFIKPAGQLALQADGITQLQVKGELHMVLTRTTSKGESLHLKFDALVVDKLNNCDVIGGQNFLIENHIDIYPRKRKISIREKYYIEETPSSISGPLIPGSSYLREKENQDECLQILTDPKYYPTCNQKPQQLKTPPSNLLSLQTPPTPWIETSEESKTCLYNLRKIGVLWPGDTMTLELPEEFPANSNIIIEPRIENKITINSALLF